MKKKYLFFISLLILFVIGIVINHFKVDNVYSGSSTTIEVVSSETKREQQEKSC